MQYCFDPNIDEPIFILDEHFGFDEVDGQGIDGSLFARELMEVDAMGKKRIIVWICSPGGNVMEGFKVYNAMLKSKTKVDTYAFGVVASIAAVCYQAGRTRAMADYALLMYHNPFNSDGTDGGEELNLLRVSLATMIATRSGKPQSEIEAVMNQTSWITADEAKEKGFCDEIEASDDHNKKRISISTDANAMWRQSKVIANSILQKENNLNMKLVCNKLKLHEASNEAAILDAIDAKDEKIAKAEAGMKEAENAKKDAEDKYAKAKNELDEFKKESEAKAKADKEAEDAKNATECMDMVTNYATIGKIKNDAPTIAKWSDLAVKIGKAECKAMIEDLPTVAKAPSIKNALQSENFVGKTSAAYLSAQVIKKANDRSKR